MNHTQKTSGALDSLPESRGRTPHSDPGRPPKSHFEVVEWALIALVALGIVWGLVATRGCGA